jgi:hypothetical protein
MASLVRARFAMPVRASIAPARVALPDAGNLTTVDGRPDFGGQRTSAGKWRMHRKARRLIALSPSCFVRMAKHHIAATFPAKSSPRSKRNKLKERLL